MRPELATLLVCLAWAAWMSAEAAMVYRRRRRP